MTGDDMRVIRKLAQMSQVELASAIGMARETIGAMERGEAPIELRTELAVRYVAEKQTGGVTASAIYGQGPFATMMPKDAGKAVYPTIVEMLRADGHIA